MDQMDMPGMVMPAADGSQQASADTFGTHGMMLAGEQTLYLSHLPMFMAPHNFQVILEVTVDSGTAARLEHSRAQFGRSKLYTFNPEPFSIVELVSNDSAKPARKAFKGSLFRGHFEKGGSLVADNVTVTVVNVVHFETLGSDTDALKDLEYLLFGKGSEKFLAHWITAPPDFDQILAINISGNGGTDDELLRGEHVVFSGRKNSPHDRLKKGEKLPGRGHITGAHQFLDIQVEAIAEIYFEEGELRSPATFDPTPEEKAAGFGS